MIKRILIPLEIEFEVDEAMMGGEITKVIIHKKVLSEKEVEKLFKSATEKGQE